MLYDSDIIYIQGMDCCGIKEISGLSYAKNSAEAMYSFMNNSYDWNQRFRYVIFSQAKTNATYGKKFAAFIRKHKLGSTVVTRGEHRNPNSGNVLKIWIWTINWFAVKTWYKKEALKQEALGATINNNDDYDA